MQAFEFLKSLNQRLDPAASKGVSAAKKVAAASKAILLGRQNGLQRVTTFGLTLAHLSKKSVGQLEVRQSPVAILIYFALTLFAHFIYCAGDAEAHGPLPHRPRPQLRVHGLPRCRGR